MRRSIRCTAFEIEQYFRGLLPQSLIVKINAHAAVASQRKKQRRVNRESTPTDSDGPQPPASTEG